MLWKNFTLSSLTSIKTQWTEEREWLCFFNLINTSLRAYVIRRIILNSHQTLWSWYSYNPQFFKLTKKPYLREVTHCSQGHVAKSSGNNRFKSQQSDFKGQILTINKCSLPSVFFYKHLLHALNQQFIPT